MKMYKVEWDKGDPHGKGERSGFTTSNFDMVAGYILGHDEQPDKFRNFTLYVGEMEEVKIEDLDINTIEKLF